MGKELKKIGMGGGCHWCTEAVFQSLKGVNSVEQGWIKNSENVTFSEAVIVEYNNHEIPLKILIQVHLLTHQAFNNHSFREKYRSAIYVFNSEDGNLVQSILNELQQEYKEKIITQVLPFHEFKPSREQIQNYYIKNPEKPFCKRYIHPKLIKIQKEFSDYYQKNYPLNSLENNG